MKTDKSTVKELERERRAARRAARQEEASAAVRQLLAIRARHNKRICSGAKQGEVALPPAVLQQVMACLAHIEADGVRGPSMAARDLANAALVSWDFHNASKHGFAALEAQAAQLELLDCMLFIRPASVRCSLNTLAWLPYLVQFGDWSWPQWAALLQDPLQCKVPELRQAARQLHMPARGSKAELVASILAAFGLQHPSSASPQLLRAVLLERCCAHPWTGCEVVGDVWDALKALGSSEVDQLWPGLGEQLSDTSNLTVADRRKALLKHTTACSNRQLLQLLQLVNMQQEQAGVFQVLQEPLQQLCAEERDDLQEPAGLVCKQLQEMSEQLREQQQQAAGALCKGLQELPVLLCKQLHEAVEQLHKELLQQTCKALQEAANIMCIGLQKLLEQVGREAQKSVEVMHAKWQEVCEHMVQDLQQLSSRQRKSVQQQHKQLQAIAQGTAQSLQVALQGLIRVLLGLVELTIEQLRMLESKWGGSDALQESVAQMCTQLQEHSGVLHQHSQKLQEQLSKAMQQLAEQMCLR